MDQLQALRTLTAEVSRQAELLAEVLNLADGKQLPQDVCQWQDKAFQRARMSLIETSRAVLQLAIGPVEYIKNEIPITIQFNSALSVIAHFDVATHVPVDGSIPLSDLADKVHVETDRLTRILRCAMAHGIFSESPIGQVRHTPTSLILREHGARAWLSHHMEEMLPASAKLIDFIETYPHTSSSKETAMSLAFPPHDAPKGYWEILEKHPWKVQRFSDGLEHATATGGSHDFREVLKVLDWKQFGAGHLVDVGGSSGRVCVAIAELAPEMRFTVQDLPELEEAAAKAIPPELKERVKFQAHNFFRPQPVADATVYLYRQILHDWPDAEAVLILRALVPALREGDTLLLMEAVIPEPGQLPPHVERLVRSADLLMMAKHNSKERTLEMWKALLQEADGRFVLKGVTVHEGCPEAGAMIEVDWSST